MPEPDSNDTNTERDPAAPPPGGVDWRVFVGVAIALVGFALVIVVAILG
jgi:hypothetical protein